MSLIDIAAPERLPPNERLILEKLSVEELNVNEPETVPEVPSERSRKIIGRTS